MTSVQNDPYTFLPLTSAVLQILLALTDGERHGYNIMQEVEARTEGKLRLGPGTLYGSIKRMLADKLIEESDCPPDPPSGHERRYYRLTTLGRRVVVAEMQRLAALVEIAREKRLLPDAYTLTHGNDIL